MLKYFLSRILTVFFLVGSLSVGSVWANPINVDEIQTREIEIAKFIKSELTKKYIEITGAPVDTIVLEISNYQLKVSPVIGKITKVVLHGIGAASASKLQGAMNFPFTVFSDVDSKEGYFQGLVDVMGPVVVSARPLLRGKTVGVNDLEMVRVPWRSIPAPIVATKMSDYVGRELTSSISRGGYLHPNNVRPVPMVRIGDKVELMMYSAPGVLIKTHAISNDAGSVGDTVRVKRPDNKKTLRAVVVGEKEVELRL